ncbi:MAG TPA: DUF4428 domain-containing protein [Clostridiales bacterium]|nr:DUF4428 domain-containing protein [Clostridiales bacterium]
MGLKDKKICAVCGEKAGIFTRIKLNDGLLCGDCVKKCSEHIEDFDEITAAEIKEHLEYRDRNKNSDMLSEFNTTLTLGDYEVLKVDENHNLWLLTTPKRFSEENPDIFYLTQVTDCEVIEKKELFTPIHPVEDEDSTVDTSNEKIKKTAELKRKLHNVRKKPPEYGYWFYIRIGVHHPCFSQIVMRVNKYIIQEANQSEYLSCKRQSQKILDTFTALCSSAKEKYGPK